MDDFGEYISLIGPKIGTDFIAIGRALMTPAICAKLLDLKDFEHGNPGFDCPRWKLDSVNKLKNVQIEALCNSSSEGSGRRMTTQRPFPFKNHPNFHRIH